jgi:hypothetical protein
MRTETLQQNTLSQVFPEGVIYAVSDCEWLRIAAAYYGLESLSVADASKLPPGANVVLLLRNSLVSAHLRRLFSGARVLVIPISSFDSELEAALYTQRLLTITDYRAASALSRYWVDNLKNHAGPLAFYTNEADDECPRDCCGPLRTDLVCSFSENLSAATWLEPVLEPGQWVSVGSFCEVSLTTEPHDEPHQFSLDGTAIASGVLVARDRHCTPAGDARIKAAAKLRNELVAAAPITLRLDDGVLTEARAGGRDFTEAIRDATNPEYGLQALELGIGTNLSVLPEVQWQVNSQLNEGAGPFHLGFGEGVTGAHMDFIVAQSAHRFAT